MNLHVINYILDRAPWPSSVFSTSSVDASKILAFVSPWFFADLGVLLFFCVIMGISGRNQEELQATGHLEPGLLGPRATLLGLSLFPGHTQAKQHPHYPWEQF